MTKPATIKTVAEFLQHVVAIDVQEAVDNESDLRAFFHAAGSLHSLRDWIFEHHKGKAWEYAGAPQAAFNGKEAFQNQLIALEPAFQYTSDVANASKHWRLDAGRKHTGMLVAANTEVKAISQRIGGSVLGGFALNTAAFNQAPVCVDRDVIIVDDNGKDIPLLPQILRVFAFWTQAIQENAW